MEGKWEKKYFSSNYLAYKPENQKKKWTIFNILKLPLPKWCSGSALITNGLNFEAEQM